VFKGVIDLSINSERKVFCDSNAFSGDDPRSKYPESSTLCSHYNAGPGFGISSKGSWTCIHRIQRCDKGWGMCDHPDAKDLALTTEEAILEDKLEKI